jgi:hypothetical protein
MRDTIDMARKSKLDIYGLGCPHDQFMEKVKAFEAFVRADEREACAKVADYYSMHDQDTPADIATAIRAGGT